MCGSPNMEKFSERYCREIWRHLRICANTGFVVTGGDVVRECLSNGSWSGSAPTCERGK